MPSPILLPLSYCFDEVSFFINPYKHFIGMYLSLQLLISNSLRNNASNAFILLISSCIAIFNVSHPYHATGHTNTPITSGVVHLKNLGEGPKIYHANKILQQQKLTSK